MATNTVYDDDTSEQGLGSVSDPNNLRIKSLNSSQLQQAEDDVDGSDEDDQDENDEQENSDTNEPSSSEAPGEASLFNDEDDRSFVDKNKNKLIVGGGIGGGALLIIGFAFFLFAFLGPLKTVHFATILRSVGFARFNLYTRRVYARTTFDAAVLTSDSTGNFKLEKRSLSEKLRRVNPEKQLRVLGNEDALKFKFDGKSTFGGLRKTNAFKGVEVNGKSITLDELAKQNFPKAESYDKLSARQRWTVESQFVSQIQTGLSDRLSVGNRAFRSSVYNGFRQAAGISMVKWVNKAKEFAGKTPAEAEKLNLQETEQRISGAGAKSGISEINNEADQYRKDVLKAAEAGKPTADVRPISKLNGKIADASGGVFLATAACIIHDLNNSIAQAKLQRERGSLQMGHDVLTAADQIKKGDITGEALGAENARWDGAEGSVLYKQATGENITRADTNQLSSIPTTDPQSTFGDVISIVNGVADNITIPVPGLASALHAIGLGSVVTGIQDKECEVILNQYVQYGIAGGELVVTVATVGGAEGVIQGIKAALYGALKLTGTVGLGEILGKLIDNSIKNIAGTEYSGVQTGTDLYSQSAVGVDALAQPGNRMISYGRHLDSQEVTGSQQLAMSEIKAENSKSSAANRYLAIDNPTSLLGSLVAKMPVSFSTLFLSLRSSMLHLSNLLVSPGNLMGSFGSLLTAGHPAFAASVTTVNGGDFGIDEQGWSNQELDRIDTDPSFSGLALAQFVEPRYDELDSKYSPCYTYELQSQKPSNCDDLLSPKSANYEESLKWRAYMAESYAADSLSKNLGSDVTQ
ncbi:MAG: hypothetical protein QFB87_00735 [Patescibacteria group bacterium]|nr:hypothetical protein [Patescibacteria group bacterium]